MGRPKRVAVLVLRGDGAAGLMGSHRQGEFRGTWGIPSTDLGESDRPQTLAAKLASTATMGMLGSARIIEKTKAGKGRWLGDTLLYTIRDVPADLEEYLNRVIGHVGESFAQSFNGGHRELLGCPTGLLPFHRVQWEPVEIGASSSRWDAHTLDVVRRLGSPTI